MLNDSTQNERPQTNGEIERFWRTIEEDLFEETNFDSLEEMKEELLQYLIIIITQDHTKELKV